MKLVNQTERISERLGDAEAVRIICESGFDGIDYSMFKMDDDPRIIGSEKKGKDGKPRASKRADLSRTFSVMGFTWQHLL